MFSVVQNYLDIVQYQVEIIIHGLLEGKINANLFIQGYIFFIRLCSDGNQADIVEFFIHPNLLTNVNAINRRHLDVQKHQIKLLFVHQFHNGGTVGQLDD